MFLVATRVEQMFLPIVWNVYSCISKSEGFQAISQIFDSFIQKKQRRPEVY